MEKILVSEVVEDSDIARVAIIGLHDEPGVAYKLFKSLARHGINVDMILQSVGRNGTKDISFTTSEENIDEAAKVISERFNNFESMDVDKKVAKVSIVGAGIQANIGVAAQMFEAFYDANINIKMISTSEISVTVLIDETNVARAMRAVNDKFSVQN